MCRVIESHGDLFMEIAQARRPLSTGNRLHTELGGNEQAEPEHLSNLTRGGELREQFLQLGSRDRRFARRVELGEDLNW